MTEAAVSLPSADTIDAALIGQARQTVAATGRPLMAVLEELAGLDAHGFTRALGGLLRYEPVGSEELNRALPQFDRLPFTECLRRGCLVLRLATGTTALVIADPFDEVLSAWAEVRFAALPRLLAHPADLRACLARYEDGVRAMEGVAVTAAAGLAREQDTEVLSLESISEDSSVVVRLVNSTIYDALQAHVSDIHLETVPAGLAIKYRVDGVLNAAGKVDGAELAEQVISRIKVMAELDIAEKRVPQDGRFKVTLKNRQIDFRVSVMPSIHGEDAVLRILDKQDLADEIQGVMLGSLGFDAATLRQLARLAARPHGMVLVTGPTGSGKTTTLYAMISQINHGHDKIITIEDPVEYQLPGVLQIPVNERKGLSFARGLRSILRHDPDKIMVGEIRDAETAQIAVQSALTGHLVFTTIHANNVFDVIGRFAQMGVDAYSFVAALNGVLAQRLLRLVCDGCARPVRHDPHELTDAGIDPASAAEFRFLHGDGCGRCRGSGYRGRTAIAEILALDDGLRQLIVDRAPIATIKEAAQRKGTRLLRESALDLLRDGRSTLAEVNRVTAVA